MNLTFLTDVTLWIGLVASVLFITANYVSQRKLVIALQTTAIILLVIQFGPIMGIWGVAILNMIFIIRNIFYSIKPLEKYTIAISIVSLIAFPVAYYMIEILPRLKDGMMLELFLLFPILAAILNTTAFMQKTTIMFKIVFGASFLSWVAFDILKEQWGNLVGDAFSVIAAIISIIILTKEERKTSKTADNK